MVLDFFGGLFAAVYECGVEGQHKTERHVGSGAFCHHDHNGGGFWILVGLGCQLPSYQCGHHAEGLHECG
jgi:hypothetical protein